MRDTFVCDLCRARVEAPSREHQVVGLYLNVYLPNKDPMGDWLSFVIEYREVCNDCREAVAEHIAAAVKSRMALAKQRQKRR